MIDKADITGIILAGGKSSRMGTDKGFLKLNTKPFVQYSIDALKPLVSNIIIVSDHSEYDSLGYKRITDDIKEAGPVSGIYSGLKASETTYNLVLSCDIPLITTIVLQKLIDAADEDSEIIQAESNGKTMPLIALYKSNIRDTFKSFLEQDERRLRIAIKACKHKNVVLDETHQNATLNVNTKEELKHIEDVYNH
ncbi:molybdenum cofactor guanylyltransferase [Hyunsoonleella pacifica]|uniref:Probable molybdenum cofactor guanylyltransferase n=1 Tax=Hyunsoonleella pacifica TaxID=1080224 RepID=A0A4Q9FQ73_9FLAO|nr:molybdenum cofactor guanylyltransferase [Hyunsoonleella pacifica]TBN17490.1 molybdenum cofactor guanylyltransferase [Hyunsoonleella pacifica]GGD11552.1 putative molybdenum cofactor guanylyltransferase [Hyunsoonleella pacifica]